MSPTENDAADDAVPDGGATAGESPFDTVSENTLSQRERYYQLLDTSLVAPLRVIWDDLRARVGVGIILFYILMGTVGLLIVEPPAPYQGPRLAGPFISMNYPLGTDISGKGVFSQIVWATPAMLKMITSGAIFTTTIATMVGLLAGYKGGTVDRALMFISDVMLTIPGLPLIIVIAVILEPRNPYVVGIILTVNAWAGLARTLRSQVLTIREEAYVEASRVMGIPTPTIVSRDILPNLMPYIMVNFVYAARNVIFSSVGLYFLGILPFGEPNWGVMMNMAYTAGGALYTLQTAHWLLFPMAAIIFLVFGLILFAQGTDRLFNPRVRARHAKTIGAEEGGSGESEDEGAATESGML